MYYFHTDGTYGKRESITEDTEWTMAIPTYRWTPAMWSNIHDIRDKQRFELAKHFNINVHKLDESTDLCVECDLSKDELNGQYWFYNRPQQLIGDDE